MKLRSVSQYSVMAPIVAPAERSGTASALTTPSPSRLGGGANRGSVARSATTIGTRDAITNAAALPGSTGSRLPISPAGRPWPTRISTSSPAAVRSNTETNGASSVSDRCAAAAAAISPAGLPSRAFWPSPASSACRRARSSSACSASRDRSDGAQPLQRRRRVHRHQLGVVEALLIDGVAGRRRADHVPTSRPDASIGSPAIRATPSSRSRRACATSAPSTPCVCTGPWLKSWPARAASPPTGSPGGRRSGATSPPAAAARRPVGGLHAVQVEQLADRARRQLVQRHRIASVSDP